MRAVIQRVSSAKVSVEGEVVGEIGHGLLIFVGLGPDDGDSDGEWLAGRVVKLRIFESQPGKMDQSLLDIAGEALVISQFTLFGSLKKGNRPSFNRAATPDLALTRYHHFVNTLSDLLGHRVRTGRFGADMKIDALHDGPVTLIVDTKDRDF